MKHKVEKQNLVLIRKSESDVNKYDRRTNRQTNISVIHALKKIPKDLHQRKKLNPYCFERVLLLVIMTMLALVDHDEAEDTQRHQRFKSASNER